MGKVTYFLGAGASAGGDTVDRGMEYYNTQGFPYMGNGIPIVRDTPGVFSNFVKQISETLYNDYIKGKSENSAIKDVRDNYPFFLLLEEMLRELEIHTTFDTIARKYWLMGRKEDLNRLKFFMNIFFIWLQMRNDFDKRYDKFLSIILKKNKNNIYLPNDFNFISWNYDMQFELAALSYFRSIAVIDTLFKKTGVIPYVGNPNYKTQENIYEQDKFNFIKLNGIAGILNNQDLISPIYDDNFDVNEEISLLKDRISKFDLKKLIDFIIARQNNITQFNAGTLQFAFEKTEKQKNALDAAKKIMNQTSTLIVIGYSFPYFNRDIDISLLSELKGAVEIIIEDLNPNLPLAIVQDIIRRLNKNTIKSSVTFTPLSDVSQFHIPFDFQHGEYIQ